jgi:hypothetical protein
LKEQLAYARETIKDQDELRRKENQIADRIDELEEELASLQ